MLPTQYPIITTPSPPPIPEFKIRNHHPRCTRPKAASADFLTASGLTFTDEDANRLLMSWSVRRGRMVVLLCM